MHLLYVHSCVLTYVFTQGVIHVHFFVFWTLASLHTGERELCINSEHYHCVTHPNLAVLITTYIDIKLMQRQRCLTKCIELPVWQIGDNGILWSNFGEVGKV